jgi:hypothetical protein
MMWRMRCQGQLWFPGWHKLLTKCLEYISASHLLSSKLTTWHKLSTSEFTTKVLFMCTMVTLNQVSIHPSCSPAEAKKMLIRLWVIHQTALQGSYLFYKPWERSIPKNHIMEGLLVSGCWYHQSLPAAAWWTISAIRSWCSLHPIVCTRALQKFSSNLSLCGGGNLT